MAIETQPESAQAPGGGDPGATHEGTRLVAAPEHPHRARRRGRRLLPRPLARQLHDRQLLARWGTSDDNDMAIVLGYAFLIVGWLIGLGVFNDLVRQMLGKPLNGNRPARGPHRQRRRRKYFRFTLDHKVVGLQYLIGMLIYFFTGGLLAMGIRTELLSPTLPRHVADHVPQVVGEHGTMMMMMMTSVILGPFGNYLVPIMIGSKRVAFPRLEALSFWLTPCAYVILLSSFLDGGFPTGWTGYAPLSIQAGEGMDGYAVAFGLMGISIILAGFNIIVTIICYRAPGMRWSRLPMFVWAMLTTGFLLVLAAPVLSRRHVHDHHRPDGADRVLRRPARRVELPVRGPVLVLRPSRGLHPGAAGIRHRRARSSRSSPGSRCSATRSPRRACSASRSCRSSSGSTTCSTPAWTRTCGRCSC